jgi:CHASE3 domain sensor protein
MNEYINKEYHYFDFKANGIILYLVLLKLILHMVALVFYLNIYKTIINHQNI